MDSFGFLKQLLWAEGVPGELVYYALVLGDVKRYRCCQLSNFKISLAKMGTLW